MCQQLSNECFIHPAWRSPRMETCSQMKQCTRWTETKASQPCPHSPLTIHSQELWHMRLFRRRRCSDEHDLIRCSPVRLKTLTPDIAAIGRYPRAIFVEDSRLRKIPDLFSEVSHQPVRIILGPRHFATQHPQILAHYLTSAHDSCPETDIIIDKVSPQRVPPRKPFVSCGCAYSLVGTIFAPSL